MKNGRSMKASLVVSVLLHSVLVGALFFIGGRSPGEQEVFFVELKSISVSPGPASGKTEKATAAKKPKAPPPKKAAKPEEKKPVEEVPRLAEANKPQVAEEIQKEAPAEDPVPVSYVEASNEQSNGNAEAQDVASSASGTGEELALSSGPDASGGYSNELLRQIRDAIQRELTYPPLARKRRIEGTVVAGFNIDMRGNPHDIEIVESSGYSVLDKEVVKIIERAAPYPYIPERVEVPVSFRLVTEKEP